MKNKLIEARAKYKRDYQMVSTREQMMREMLTGIFEDKLAQAISEFDILEPKEKWNVLLKMLPYIAPRLTAVTVEQKKHSAIDELMDKMAMMSTDADVIG